MLRDQTGRRRMELNPLTTALNAAQQYSHPAHQTPQSGLSQPSLSAQFGYNPSSFSPTPVSSVHQYNPQQWGSSPTPHSGGQLSGGRMQMPMQMADPDVVVPAPPPYSPPRSNRASMIFADDQASGLSPSARSPANNHTSNGNGYRASPELTSNPIFPPPPGGRNRSGSSGPPAIFSAFSRRTPPEAPRLSPEVNRDHAPPHTRRPAPIVVDAPIPQTFDDRSQFVDARPPASRRAASTGAISTTSSQPQSRSQSRSRWEPGMPLPPPPPGPPPPTSRSQSMTRTTDRVVSPPTRRPGAMSTLGPVPPTPAGWVDEDAVGRGRSPNRGLQIDTSSVGSSTVAGDTSNSGSSSSGLARARHVRGEPQSIRERRAESKTRKSVDERSNNPWAESIVPSDIVTNTTTNGLTRRPTMSKSTPRSARSIQIESPNPSASMHNTPVPNTGGSMSRGSTTPRPYGSSNRPGAPTPPFSSGQLKTSMNEPPSVMTPKALPTPPPQSRLLPIESPRPVSHILHMPNNEHVTIPTLVPSKTHSRQASENRSSQISATEQFARDAIERHGAFAQKEATATNNEERVRLFADFIVAESRLRRGQYSEAIDGMGSEILELTRDLFRPYSKVRRASSTSRSAEVWTPGSAGPKPSPDVHTHRGSIMAALHDGPQLQSNQEPNQGSTASSPATRPDSTWWGGYMPSLSPIPSMQSASEALSGSDSRGRPASRWWEVSQEGGSIGAPSGKMERSKRESKYMGMPRELREALQYENGDGGSSHNGNDAGVSSSNGQRSYGPNEYPPEKTGWHDQDMASTPMQSARSPAPFSPAPPRTPNPRHLDVSRLVTLPPPYPRHHPAVNNNHPDLTEIRIEVRNLSDFSEVEATKTRFEEDASNIREDLVVEAAKRRNSLRASINRGIEAGSMSYADAAKMEAESVQLEEEKTKEAAKAEFDLFQHQVVGPLNDLLMDRLNQATEIFNKLRSKLFVDAQQESPNVAQEEGDEQPELLEKLTLLKWIFEAREQMHRELFDLLSDRNNRYRDMVIMPYRLAKNEEKVAGAKAFFAEDAGKRTLQFEQEILKRTEEFMDVVEENVVRGVEVQLSAFWDIAPSLSRITEKIPANLDGFQIQIPNDEYEENPGYWDYPMRYLYTLVGHCEKSTYQFIESQTNLLCLLHEVKSGVTIANCRLMRTQRVQQGEDREVVERELQEVELDEEGRLTLDLKEKVRCVEELWTSALGEEMKNVKGRIVSFLLSQGAWEEDE